MTGAESSDQDRLRSLLSIPHIFGARVSNRRDKIGIFSNATGRFELYSLPLAGSSMIQLSHGELERTPTPVIVWNTDDQEIVLSRDHEGDELHDLYRFRLGTRAAEQLTHDRTCQRYPWEFSPDGRWLLFASDKGAEGEARQLDFWRMPATGGRRPAAHPSCAADLSLLFSERIPTGREEDRGRSERDRRSQRRRGLRREIRTDRDRNSSTP